MARLSRAAYADMFGPTTGDRVRLADTELFIEVERDLTIYGEEVKFGGGKVIRDGMGQSQASQAEGAVDTVITNALILDHWGIVKADVGDHGTAASRGIGKAGNPDIQPGVDIVIGPGTEIIAGEGKILTAGGIDAHIHFICPQQVEEAIASGITTMIGGGTGPATGTAATTCTPGPWHIARMLQAAEGLPVNLGFRRQGQRLATRRRCEEMIRAGACGLKLHEDWGTTPAAIDCALSVADRFDVQVMIHTDTLNESGFVEDDDRGLQGPHDPRLPHRGRRRRPRAGHHQGRRSAERAAEFDQPDPALHGQHARRAPRHADGVPSPRPRHPRGRRLRRKPHPQGDDRRRGHPARPRRALDDVVGQPGDGPGRRGHHPHLADRAQDEAPARRACPATARHDNNRVKRYIAKYTINPAIAQGIAHEVGSVEAGKLADLVLWSPAFFGVKPDLVIKGGTIAWAAMGDPNASIPTPQPVHYRPMFGAFGGALAAGCVTFVSARRAGGRDRRDARVCGGRSSPSGTRAAASASGR